MNFGIIDYIYYTSDCSRIHQKEIGERNITPKVEAVVLINFLVFPSGEGDRETLAQQSNSREKRYKYV